MDENIHIVSAFQILGFTYVVGTLWEVEESTSTSFANHFYGSLAKRVEGNDEREDSKARNLVTQA